MQFMSNQQQDLPSIYIPHVSQWATKYYIKNIFNKLNWGIIQKIYIYHKKSYNQIFIDFSTWHINNPQTTIIRNKLLEGKTINVMHDYPWFWKCSKSFYKKRC